ncbi:MAG: D-amino-acid transaminase [Hyphomicrobiales bacterium]|nr:D-amino-acid transaminase [Hyphomicrobiales bacterium]
MTRTAYVNGQYMPLGVASVRIEDRGLQFADAAYEVCEIKAGRIIDERRHMERLGRSLDALQIPMPMSQAALGAIMREVVRRNRVRDGIVYLQVSRGVAARNHAFPRAPVRPGIVVTARRSDTIEMTRRADQGVTVITLPDNRWERVDIKTVGLLPNVLAKQKAVDAGAFEAWLIDKGGFVTEGSATNAWIVQKDGTLVTRPADRGILRGITRGTLFEVVAGEGLRIEERPFTVAEAKTASEAFLTGSSLSIMPVVEIDGHAIGRRQPGPITARLRAVFHDYAEIGPVWSSLVP